MTQVTCLQLKTCSNVNFRIRTHITGPPERISDGATLHDIFIPAEEHPKKSSYKWVAWRGSTVPENAVPGGEDTYVCRAIHDGKFTPGKLFTPHSKCYISYGGFEHGYDEYETLLGHQITV
ncbi:hypothetical protein HPB52_016791 [Rhipicephalus sanguineus]|uniref:Uncharacterized protein n=1 Tax=Rhipicephalus sanguineus TaxID=34632 RepID=A0A9D4SPY6_RHISA|nr:hypothetical protein HPB52_016791 [Rhipicephalus sanguineus]